MTCLEIYNKPLNVQEEAGLGQGCLGSSVENGGLLSRGEFILLLKAMAPVMDEPGKLRGTLGQLCSVKRWP